MVRITKDPEVRRNELMDAAERLFLEKGYDHTSASDIIRAVGVAQGTFYYYFKSKDEILDAVIDRYFESYAKFIEQIADDRRMDALQKLLYIVETLFSEKRGKSRPAGHRDLERKVSQHERYQQHIDEKITPIIMRIVKQGILEGIFDVEYPTETTELIVLIVEHLHDDIRLRDDRKRRKTTMKVAWSMIEKALNVPPGSIQLHS
ncbi:MAG TPA: TetR/AcrR family transcriptional regulator [Methanocella sp.]|nr:TetR/AcrR family transcriptional regulator [Methanocella sp.]